MPAEAHPEKRKALKKLSPETIASMRALDEDGRLPIPVLPPTPLSEALRKAREVLRLERKLRGGALTHDLQLLEKAIDLLVAEVIG